MYLVPGAAPQLLYHFWCAPGPMWRSTSVCLSLGTVNSQWLSCKNSTTRMYGSSSKDMSRFIYGWLRNRSQCRVLHSLWIEPESMRQHRNLISAYRIRNNIQRHKEQEFYFQLLPLNLLAQKTVHITQLVLTRVRNFDFILPHLLGGCVTTTRSMKTVPQFPNQSRPCIEMSFFSAILTWKMASFRWPGS